MEKLSRRWSKDEIAVALDAAPPGVREFLRGLHLRDAASLEDLGLGPAVVHSATQLFRQRDKVPLFEVRSQPGERPVLYGIPSEFRRSLGEVLRVLPPPIASRAIRPGRRARAASGPSLSAFRFRFEKPAEAAGLIGLASFLNERVPTGLSFMVSGNGREFVLEVR